MRPFSGGRAIGEFSSNVRANVGRPVNTPKKGARGRRPRRSDGRFSVTVLTEGRTILSLIFLQKLGH